MAKAKPGDLAEPVDKVNTIRELIRTAWRYRARVLLAFVASLGMSIGIIGRGPLALPLIDKIFPRSEFGSPTDPDTSKLPVLPIDGVVPSAAEETVADTPGSDEAGTTRMLSRSDPIWVQIPGMFARDTRIPKDDRGYFLTLVVILAALLGVIGSVSTYYGIVWGRQVQFLALNDVRIRVYRHLVGLSLPFYHRQKSGDLLSRLTNDLLLTQRMLNFMLIEFVQHPVRIVVALVTGLVMSWKLTLILVFVMPIIVWPLLYLGKRVFRAAKKRQVEQADLTQAMLQTFSGIRVVQAFQMEEGETQRFRVVNERFLGRSMKVERAKATARALTELIYSVGTPLLLLGGGFLILEGMFTLGTLLTLFLIMGLAYPSIKSLSKVFNQMLECLAGAERVFGLLDERPDIVDRPGAKPMPKLERSIRFDRVTFAYGDEPVLHGVDFEVPVGKMIAIVGPSGAGKSTTLDLIARFYDPVDGSVRFDDIDLRDLQRDSILENLAVVTQEAFLFNTTIGENIRFARPDATQAEVEEAARAAQIHDFIESLPRGYETIVGERGSLLSGGQRQRVTIARAILRNPPLLLLDEATSSLDTESEVLVQKALRSLLRGRTTFVIAHRLSTVQDADHILVLEGGRLVEQGTHESLINKRGIYSKLYEIQFQKAETG